MRSTNENDRGAGGAGTSRPPSPERERQRRRIWRTTRALALGGVAATAAFVFAAAHGGTRSPATSNAVQPSGTGTTGVPLTSEDGYGEDGGGESSDDDGGSYSAPSLAPSQSSPTPSYSPPVTNTGGS